MRKKRDPEETAALKWWRERHPEAKGARLVTCRAHGCVTEVLALPPRSGYWRGDWNRRTLAGLSEIVEEYRATTPAGVLS